MEDDLPADGQLEVRRLYPAVGRVAVGELPLLAITWTGRPGAGGLKAGLGPCPPPDPASASSAVPKAARKSTMIVVTTSQGTGRGGRRGSPPLPAARLLAAEDDQGVGEIDQDRAAIGVTIAEQDGVVEDLARGGGGRLPGGRVGAMTATTIGVAIALSTSDGDRDPPQWFGSSPGSPHATWRNPSM